MKIKATGKLAMVLLIVMAIASTVLLSGCESTNNRVSEALEKMEAMEAAVIVGYVDAEVETDGVEMDMTGEYEIVMSGENVSMIMTTQTDGMELSIEIYLVDGEFYMYLPDLLDVYIDASKLLADIEDQMGMDMTVFDFDVDNTELEIEETTIGLDGQDIEVLEIRVLLDEDQLTDIITDLFAQQNFASDTLSGQALDAAADMYESMEIESAEYTLYIDENNDVKRYLIDTILSMEVMGQVIKYDMRMYYDILETGDSISVDMPDIPQDKIIPFDALFTGQ